MKEERLEYLINTMYYNYLDQIEAQELIDYIKNLQQRISKAIEWINNHIDTFEERNITIYDWDSLSDPKKLLEILEDKEKK